MTSARSRQPGPMDPPQQLLGLAGEHRAGDHVQSSCLHGAHGMRRLRAPRIPLRPGCAKYSARMSTRRPPPWPAGSPPRRTWPPSPQPDPDSIDDVLPDPSAHSDPLRLLIVGINPGLWTRGGQRAFRAPRQPVLALAAPCGAHLAGWSTPPAAWIQRTSRISTARGIGITNLIGRATVRADELGREELRARGAHLIERLEQLRPARSRSPGSPRSGPRTPCPRYSWASRTRRRSTGWPAPHHAMGGAAAERAERPRHVASLAENWREVARSAGLEHTSSD